MNKEKAEETMNHTVILARVQFILCTVDKKTGDQGSGSMFRLFKLPDLKALLKYSFVQRNCYIVT